jgi:hypothetical protein
MRCGEASLLWSGVGEGDTLLDVALETINTGLEEGLLVVVEVAERVNGLLSTVCLYKTSAKTIHSYAWYGEVLTPSSIGTEKYSKPVSLAMASPPGTPGR